MTGCSNSLSSFGPSRPGASQKPPASSASRSLPLRARSRRSRSGWASSSSPGRRGRFRPPTAGEALLARARDALAAVEDAENAARGADRLSGVLRVALPSTYGARRIAPLLPAFLERRPLLKIDLMMSDRYENLDRRRRRPRAEGRRAAGLEFRGAQARKRETSLRRRAVLPGAAGRAEEPRRPCRARLDRRRSCRAGRTELGRAPERSDRGRRWSKPRSACARRRALSPAERFQVTSPSPFPGLRLSQSV